MISTLLFRDRDVRARLFEKVERAPRPLLVTAVRHGKSMRAPELREPFVGLERDFGDGLDQVLVADEGGVEGMWRDPLGDLADALFPEDRAEAYAAANGYLLLDRRRVLGVVKKRGDARADRWFLQERLAAVVPGIPLPDPAQRPGRANTRAVEDEPTSPGTRAPKPLGADPWQVLGLTPGTPRGEARKSFRALVAQYHPDKVAHIAPEFRELADRRTRELLAAWELLEAVFSDD